MSNIHQGEYKKIVAKLREAREAAGLTQSYIAKIFGKPQSYISKIELGERRLDVAELKKFATLYKKSASFFLHD